MPEGAQGGKKAAAKGQLLPVFTDRIADLRLQAQRTHNAIQGRHQRRWAVPEGQESLLDIENLHVPAFDRQELNDQYTELTESVESAGTTADVMANKQQIAYVAVEERAFRARHSTICRAFCHGHGRRYGHGQGSLLSPAGGITKNLSTLLQAGAQSTGG